MLNFFPVLYPDEIFYSVVARYHKRSGNTNILVTAFELFGKKGKKLAFDFPNDLDFLTSRLPNYSSEDIIYNHSLFNYYSPFIPSKNRESLFKKMRSGSGNGSAALVGRSNRLSFRGEYLCYCPICAVDDYMEYGEAYFHRLHQIPGVLVCQTHFCLLKNYPIKLAESNSYQYHSCDIKLIDLENTYIDKVEYHAHILRLAKSTEFLLKSNVINIDLHEITRRYHICLDLFDLLCTNGDINQTKLINDFKNYYGEFLSIIKCDLDVNNKENWLIFITRNTGKILPPLYHILLIQFFTESFGDFFAEHLDLSLIHNYKQENQNNKLQQYKEHLINYINNHPNLNRTRIMEQFYVETKYLFKNDQNWLMSALPKSTRTSRCSTITLNNSKLIILNYIQSHPNCIREDIYRVLTNEYKQCKQYDLGWFNENMPKPLINRSKDFDIKLDKYRSILAKYKDKYQGCNKSEAMIDNKTEYTWLFRNDRNWLDNTIPRCKGGSLSKRRKTIDQCREKLVQFIEVNPGCTRSEIDNNRSKEYRQCRMNDIEWFEKNMPPKLTMLKFRKLTNWEEKDNEIHKILKQFVDREDNTLNLKGLTKYKITKLLPINYRSTILNYINKLPITKQYIDYLLNIKLIILIFYPLIHNLT